MWEQMRKAVAEAVDKRQMHIGINSMETMRYGTRMVSSDFFLELRGDTIRSYLPYLGQAHRAPVTWASQGLDFEAQVNATTCNRSIATPSVSMANWKMPNKQPTTTGCLRQPRGRR